MGMYGDKLHPLVRVCSLAELTEQDLALCFVVVLHGRQGCVCTGCTSCDFRDSTLMFFCPGEGRETIERMKSVEARCLCFCGDWLGRSLDSNESWQAKYRFFHYTLKESLHLSLREKTVIDACLDDIRKELEWGVDNFSSELLALRIHVLLNECLRFYERQFITRSCVCKCLMGKIERMVDEYVASGEYDICRTLSSAAPFASRLEMSEAFFADFLKFETGKTVPQYLSFRHFEVAKRILRSSADTLTCVSRRLGYSSVSCFSLAFKRVVGCTPSEYKHVN